MKPLVIAIVAALVIVVGAGSFFAGSAYGQQQAQNIRSDFFRARQSGNGTPNGNGTQGQNGQGGQFGRPAAAGTVKSINGNTLVITQQDGSTVTVTLDVQTQIIKTVNGTTSDLQPGERITVMSDQTTGNIVARTIQLRPTAQTQ